MAIKRIEIANFKSFNATAIDLGKLNILIGANSSGKSNFIQIFRFIRDIATYGLVDAISLQGGIDYLRNAKIGSSEPLKLRIVTDQQYGVTLLARKRPAVTRVQAIETDYEFWIEFKKTRGGFRIPFENLRITFAPMSPHEKKGGKAILTIVDGKPRSSFEPSDLEEDYGLPIRSEKLPPKSLILGLQSVPSLYPRLDFLRTSISIYDFDPKQLKKAVPIAGKAELAEDGSNLAIALKNIIQVKEKRRMFSNLIQDLFPYIDHIGIEKFADRSMLFKLREKYAQRFDLPAPFISDGTVNLVALIVAIYFESRPMIILEEPERNIHPFLISKLVDMLEEASKKKQIIVTTHNPEVVKHAGLKNILLIARDAEGFSKVSKPAEMETVKSFLQNEIGIEELYVQNLLEG